MAKKFRVEDNGAPLAARPWTLENAPVQIRAYGVEHPLWTTYQGGAWAVAVEPYGCSTLRISAFPSIR